MITNSPDWRLMHFPTLLCNKCIFSHPELQLQPMDPWHREYHCRLSLPRSPHPNTVTNTTPPLLGLTSIGFCDVTDNPFLATLCTERCTQPIWAFAHAVQQAEFRKNRNTPLASATVRDTIASLSADFVDNNRPDPSTNVKKHGKTHRILRLHFSAYWHTDLAVKHQRALTIEFSLKLYFQS